jgi:general secretion pathway protein L
MLAGAFSWWLARITEMLPDRSSRLRNGILIEADDSDDVMSSIRHNGRSTPITLPAAARKSRRTPVIVRPRPEAVLTKHHTVPTVQPNQLHQLLRHELARITPFASQDLFWRWEGHRVPHDRGRTHVTITMVPRVALMPVLAALDTAGLKPDFLEVGPADRPILLPASDVGNGATGSARGLAGLAAALAVVALLLPVGLQALALHRTNAGIAALQPTIAKVEGLRHEMGASGANHDIVAQETARIGNALQVIASMTQILPDDTYLTDFTLRERHLTLGGRSASAAGLIAALSANPTIRSASFAAPVTRPPGATTDVFSIKAEVTK